MASLVSGLCLTVPLAASTLAEPAPDPSPLTMASLQAQQSGQAVPVASETTDTSEVTAQPDGSFVLHASLLPVRTKVDGNWTPINTDLHRNGDGSIAPAATEGNVTFSGGGSQPAITIDNGDTSLSIDLPGDLPEPSLDGPTATYPAVLPGVDLKLTATATGYTEVLVVHDAAAAANPDLATLKMTVHADGVKVASDGDGGLSVTGNDPDNDLHGSAPTMWDSSHTDGPVPTATNPSSGNVDVIPMSVPTADGTDHPAATTLTLTPSAEALRGPDVQYPVYIDPALNPNRSHFAVVTTSNNWHYYDDTSNDLKVGFCDWSDCAGSWKARTFLAFNTSALGGKPTTAKVYSAQVDAYEIHNAHGCTPEPVDLYTTTAGINSSTDWPGPSGRVLQSKSSNRGNTCSSAPAGVVSFNNSDLAAYLQTAATNEVDTTTVGLRANDEGDKNQWKRFDDAASGTAAAQLTVRYAFPPSTPYGLKISYSVSCPGKLTYTTDATPTFSGQATDYNSPHIQVAHHFSVYRGVDQGIVRYNTTGVVGNSDAVTAWTIGSSNSNSTGVLPQENDYKFNDYATAVSSDTTDYPGATSAWNAFGVDATPPSIPTISSFDYPSAEWGKNGSGTFTFAGSTDTAGFTYSYDQSGAETIPAVTDCSYNRTATTAGGWAAASSGKATITAPAALTVGYHTLYVRGFDDAHNVSGQSAAYVFYQAPNYGQGSSTRYQVDTWSPTTASCQGKCEVYKEAVSAAEGGYQEHFATDNARSRFTVGQFTVGAEADYALNLNAFTWRSYGILRFHLTGGDLDVDLSNGAVKSDGSLTYEFDTYASPPASSPPPVKTIALGGAHLKPGNTYTLSMTFAGANTSVQSASYTYPDGQTFDSGGLDAGIDSVRVVAVANTTAASLTAAMNNDGITADGAAAGDINPSLSHASLSQNTLQSLGLTAGASVTLPTATSDDPNVTDTTTFTMPAYQASGLDNVVAMGQVIPLPNHPSGSWVDLLVTSTCGATPIYDPRYQLSINFSDTSIGTSTTPLEQTPDWTDAAAQLSGDPDSRIAVAATLPYRRLGTTTDSTLHPRLYVISIATKNSTPIDSVQLPYFGTSLTETCTNAASGTHNSALHVFAISTH